MANCISRPSSASSSIALLALAVGQVCLAATPPAAAAPATVTSVKYWSVGPIIRISVDVSAPFKFKASRLTGPDRIFFDIQGKPVLKDRAMHTIAVGEPLLKQIRVAETQPGVTRIVLDLADHNPLAEFVVSQLNHPERLMIELSAKSATPSAVSSVGSQRLTTAPASTPTADFSAKPPKKHREPFIPPPPQPDTVSEPAPPASIPPTILWATTPPPLYAAKPVSMTTGSVLGKPLAPPPLSLRTPEPVLAKVTEPKVSEPKALEPKPAKADPKLAGPEPIPARASTAQSMTRVLGLKLGRVVLDAGHGGHDVGTHGPSGLLEKDLVLDVTLRLGEMLKSKLGTDVVYTRDSDIYVPLEDRTNIANERKADLFLSIHANSSQVKTAAGVETFYLSFTNLKTSNDLATRENAGSNRTIFELKEQLQKVALNDKLEESRQFARRLQTSLSTLSARTNDAAKNRGVKQAPFVVLIGATMPSVLAEIGFLTNPADEALLKKPDHRQKIAEALYKGIASYADSLSRFQLAQR